MNRDALCKLIEDNLSYSSDTSRLRWIMDANGWKTADDVQRDATDEQIKAFSRVWGPAAYAC